jgi:hypothetical protein
MRAISTPRIASSRYLYRMPLTMMPDSQFALASYSEAEFRQMKTDGGWGWSNCGRARRFFAVEPVCTDCQMAAKIVLQRTWAGRSSSRVRIANTRRASAAAPTPASTALCKPSSASIAAGFLTCLPVSGCARERREAGFPLGWKAKSDRMTCCPPAPTFRQSGCWKIRGASLHPDGALRIQSSNGTGLR